MGNPDLGIPGNFIHEENISEVKTGGGVGFAVWKGLAFSFFTSLRERERESLRRGGAERQSPKQTPDVGLSLMSHETMT